MPIKVKVYNTIIHLLKRTNFYSALAKESLKCARDVQQLLPAVAKAFAMWRSYTPQTLQPFNAMRYEFSFSFKQVNAALLATQLADLRNYLCANLHSVFGAENAQALEEQYRYLPLATWLASLEYYEQRVTNSRLRFIKNQHPVTTRAIHQLRATQSVLGTVSLSLMQLLIIAKESAAGKSVVEFEADYIEWPGRKQQQRNLPATSRSGTSHGMSDARVK